MYKIDWFFLIGTLVFIALYGVWKNNKHLSVKSYLKGDNKSRWWTIGLSVMATQASAITFLSTPGQAYDQGMGFIQFYFGLPFAMIIICMFFLPVYKKLKVYTAYEFLENRFDLKTRTLTAILFLIQRGLAAGITIYAPAIILSVVLGWNLKILVVIIGFVVIFYTLLGGTNAVNVTHKQQMLLIIIGLISAFVVAVDKIPKDINFTDIIKLASYNEKLNILNFELDLKSRYTFWSGITGGLFLALSYFGTDQSQVQRYLSGKSLKESQIGLIMNGFLKIPFQFFILLLGIIIFVFYQYETPPIHFNPKNVTEIKKSKYANQFLVVENEFKILENKKHEILIKANFFNNSILKNKYTELNKSSNDKRKKAKNLIVKNNSFSSTNDRDYIFITFIINYLPNGLIGLLLAVILAAAMSSTASELNALSATALVDLYKRHRPNLTQIHYVNMAKLFTLIWGVIAIIFALTGNLFENLIQLVNIIGSIFYGTILGIFLVAIFIKKIKSNPVFFAAIISEIIVISFYYIDLFGYLWLNIVGAFLTVLFSMIIQITFFKKNN
ncbi:MAG: sodium:solute symporter [Flavobacteriaceae bacterium]|nr:sodium:solute symporter [Flavobacteriaceae bacterium]|tara:strand:- start:1173 stop:2840 length:1668 start_codon:yes stop_codon:yes gene_type:complete